MPLIEVRCELPGRICALEASEGERVAEDSPLVMLESMKMEIPVAAPVDGVVREIRVQVDDTVAEGDVIAVLET